MEDRYLSKAKRISDGEWVVGGLVRYGFAGKEKYYIVPDYASDLYAIEIDPNTICRCTGSRDKNGNLIWENDIVRFKHEKFDFDDGLEPFERTCLPNKKEYKRNYVVELCNTPTHYGLRFRNGSIWFMVHKMIVVMHDTEVIGNIFDNKELLESEENKK